MRPPACAEPAVDAAQIQLGESSPTPRRDATATPLTGSDRLAEREAQLAVAGHEPGTQAPRVAPAGLKLARRRVALRADAAARMPAANCCGSTANVPR